MREQKLGDQRSGNASKYLPDVARTITDVEPEKALKRDYDYYREVFRGRHMPFAFVDLDLLDQNIRAVAARAAGKHIRLASKSLRCLAMIDRILLADDCFGGVMCYSAQEAAYLASHGLDDLLIGYPAWHEHDITAVAQILAAGKQVTMMVDSLEHVEHIEQVAGRLNARIPLCLEIDMSIDPPGLHFGVWRSALRTPGQARPIIERIMSASHVYLDGLMGYEAQIAGVADNVPGQFAKNELIKRLKHRSAGVDEERRAAILDVVKSYGITPRFVNGGGTGSMATTGAEDAVTEITVGSAFYAPALFDHYRDFRYQPAAAYAIEIVRHPRPDIYTCLGGGYIASGATSREKQPVPYLPSGAKLISLEGAGEVQTPVRYTGPIELGMGDPIFMRHSKAGELCERFTHLLLVSQGKVVDEVPTYRGENLCFV